MQAHLLYCVNLTVKGKLNENIFVIFLNNMLTVKRPSGFATGQVWPRYHFFFPMSLLVFTIHICFLIYDRYFNMFYGLQIWFSRFLELELFPSSFWGLKCDLSVTPRAVSHGSLC